MWGQCFDWFWSDYGPVANFGFGNEFAFYINPWISCPVDQFQELTEKNCSLKAVLFSAS
jgi:hypothetical protein